MKKIILALLALMTVHALSSTASAETTPPEKLKGTWIIDARATEEFLRRSPLMPKDSEKFLDMSAIMFQLVYDFGDGVVTASIYNGNKKNTYRFLPEHSDAIKYISDKKPSSSDDFLTVSIIGDKNITISSSQNQVMGYFLFRRVKLDPETRAHDAKLALEAWRVAIQEFAKILSVTK